MGSGRPAGVTAVAILDVVEGALLGAVGLLLLWRIVQLSLRRGDFSLFDTVFYLVITAILLIFGYGFVRVGMGLWRLQRWARVPSLLFALLIVILALIGLLTLPRLGGTLLGLGLLVLHAWVVWYLRRPLIKDAFSG